ncbi:MAG: SDR family oxidoreductase [Clostridia bacterium]|nr:SDR family oxidoreductase [Clostridia bacterium]
MRSVLITGASRGIGAAAAERFAANGYRVFVNYNRSEEKALALCGRINAGGGSAYPVRADVNDREAVRRMISVCRYHGGGIDVLVNNAGIDFYGAFGATEPQIWDDVIGTDLTGVYNVTYAALPELLQSERGRIINVSSVWGVSGGSCEVAYSAAKAGVIGFTKALAKELGPDGVTVNCVAPGYIDTDMNAGFDRQTVEDIIDRTPLCRTGTADDVAGAILWLCSESAGFVTGQVIGVDGGFM